MEPEGSLLHSHVFCLREHFVTWHVFTVKSCWHLAQTTSWRTTLCRFSATASKCSPRPSISVGRSSIRNLRTHHAIVTGTHL